MQFKYSTNLLTKHFIIIKNDSDLLEINLITAPNSCHNKNHHSSSLSTWCGPEPLLTLRNVITLTETRRESDDLHFTDGELEDGDGTCPRSHRQSRAEVVFEPRRIPLGRHVKASTE